MVGARKTDRAALCRFTNKLPVLERKLECDFDGVGAIVGIETTRKSTTRQAGKLFSKCRGGWVVKAKQCEARWMVIDANGKWVLR
jgi:hypothetical protein